MHTPNPQLSGEQEDRGLLLRCEREARTWPLRYVARAIQATAERLGLPTPGIDANAVSRWERGAAAPSAKYVRMLCLLYGRSPDELSLPVTATFWHDLGDVIGGAAAGVAADVDAGRISPHEAIRLLQKEAGMASDPEIDPEIEFLQEEAEIAGDPDEPVLPADGRVVATSVSIVDHRLAFRLGLASLVTRWPELEPVVIASNLRAFDNEMAARGGPRTSAHHVIVLSYPLPHVGAEPAIESLRVRGFAPLAVISTAKPELADEALRRGALGVITEAVEANEMLSAIRTVAQGAGYIGSALRGLPQRRRADLAVEQLTPREREMLILVAEGLVDKEIAHHLFLSPKTVSNSLGHIRSKTGRRNRAQLARLAVELGLVGPTSSES
jgi:DNA-binding NarL/FixJ family response regulator/transcriptional regulator with XRE-family HTH domain